MRQQQQQPLQVVCLVAPEEVSFLAQWEEHLWPLQEEGYLIAWSELHLSIEMSRQEEVLAHLQRADLIILLVSPAFFASAECLVLMEQALDRHNAEEAQLLFLRLQSVDDRAESLVSFLSLPSNGLPIDQWDDAQAAFRACVQSLLVLMKPEGIALTLEALQAVPASPPPVDEPALSEANLCPDLLASRQEAVRSYMPDRSRKALAWSWKRAFFSLPGSLLLGVTGGVCAILLYGLFAWFSHGRVIGLFYALFVSIPAILPLGALFGIGGALLGSALYGFLGNRSAEDDTYQAFEEHEETVG